MGKKIDISRYDEATFQTIKDKFSQNILDNYRGDAEYKLGQGLKSLKLRDAFRIFAAGYRLKHNSLCSSSQGRVSALAAYNDASLPALNQAFGEDMVFEAIPEEAKNERVIQICRQSGAHDFADLCQKALENKPS